MEEKKPYLVVALQLRGSCVYLSLGLNGSRLSDAEQRSCHKTSVLTLCLSNITYGLFVCNERGTTCITTITPHKRAVQFL